MVLLNPGPVNISLRVRKALHGQDICHREEEFSTLLKNIHQKLLDAFVDNEDYLPIVISASGTAAVESAITSALPPNKKILIVKNGVYGERISEIARAYQLNTIELEFSWTEQPSILEIETTLKNNPSIELVALVHHETTTGLLNPIEAIGVLAEKYQKTFLVDAVSSIGGEIINLRKSSIDVLVGTAGKCIQGVPGVSFCLVRASLMEKIKSYPKRSIFLHMPAYSNHGNEVGIPFTPSIQVYYAFYEALRELLEEGVDRRIRRYNRAACFLRKSFEKLRLSCLIPKEYASNTITAVKIPKTHTYLELHDHLKACGYIIYAGQGSLYSNIFRVANMGALQQSDFENFIEHLERYLNQYNRV